MNRLREVTLPTCPECKRVGKFAGADAALVGQPEFFCRGPRGEEHKRVRMVPKTFREVRS